MIIQSHGSQQLRRLRIAIRAGASIEDAAEQSGIPLAEARDHAARDIKFPPPPEAFVLLTSPDASAAASQPKEEDMAERRKAREDDDGEIKAKDFAGAVRAYRADIKPAISKVGEFAQEVSTAFKHIKKNCHIQPGAAKLAFKLDDMEEAKCDDFLRCFTGLLKELNIPLQSDDLVDRAERSAAPNPKPMPPADPGDGTESDPGDTFEASPEELAQQEGRAVRRTEERATESLPAPMPGTGRAARKAMSEAASLQ